MYVIGSFISEESSVTGIVSLSFYPSEILGFTFYQKDRLGIWPGVLFMELC